MRVKVEMNSKGEVKAHRIEIPIQGGGGELGQHAVAGLVSLISSLKEMKTERELEQLLSMVYGWGACCKYCGFLTEKSTDDVMHMAEELAEIESNGEYGAIEFERVGIMTDFEYTDDLFGEDNRTLKPTMQLIHTQNEGIINAVKNSANIRFLAKVANMLKPEDIKKERQRFTEDNLSADNDSGMIIYDNKFSELKQVESKPYTPNALQMQNIQENVCTHFGTNMDILQNKFDENTWNAYYEGKIEPFAIQLSLVMTNMSFTERERACGNAIFFSANRLQYASNATKLSVSTQLFDRALLNRNGVMDIWNMAHVEDGEKYYIRKEYTEVSELQNSNRKPQIIIQQEPIATGQQAEPQQTPPAAAGEPAGGLGEKEGVNNAD